jgi:exonuclease VII large subunit
MIAGASPRANKELKEKSKQYRKYLIEVEKKYKMLMDVTTLTPELRALIKMELRQNELEKQNKIIFNQVKEIKETFVKDYEDWREEINDLIIRIQKCSNFSYSELRRETYAELENRAKCNLKRRLTYLKERLKNEGHTKTKLNKINRLDVIERDVKLKAIYTQIIKEYVIKYVV